MKKRKKTLFITVAVLLILWSAIFITDLVRCHNLKEPVFAVADVTADDGGSGIYKGLGYTVEIERHIDAQYGVRTDYVEMKLFGIMVLAVTVD